MLTERVLKAGAPWTARATVACAPDEDIAILPFVGWVIGGIMFAAALGSGIIGGLLADHFGDVIVGIVLCSVGLALILTGTVLWTGWRRGTVNVNYSYLDELRRVKRDYEDLKDAQASVRPLVDGIYHWAAEETRCTGDERYGANKEWRKRAKKLAEIRATYKEMAGVSAKVAPADDLDAADALLDGMRDLQRRLGRQG